MLAVGDYVVRVSYGKDILFRITAVLPSKIAKLKGVSYRVIADAPLSDLELASGMRFTNQETSIMQKIEKSVEVILKERAQLKKTPILEKTGTVLHIDGDMFYLNLCLKYYQTLDIPAIGEHVSEMDQPKKIKYLLEKHNPDILVITGHDALNKHYKDLHDITQYRNSSYFIDTVKKARLIKPNMDDLVIFAGACQSYFEGILEAGADFAASPDRVLIHALDPVFLVEKIAHCPFHKVLPIETALENTITKFKGLGGYEIVGKYRRGGPVGQMVGAMEVETEKVTEELDIERAEIEEVKRELKKPLFTDTEEEFIEKLKNSIAEITKSLQVE